VLVAPTLLAVLALPRAVATRIPIRPSPPATSPAFASPPATSLTAPDAPSASTAPSPRASASMVSAQPAGDSDNLLRRFFSSSIPSSQEDASEKKKFIVSDLECVFGPPVLLYYFHQLRTR